MGMSNEEFITSMVGVQWVFRKSSLDGADCWGVVVLYYRLVHGIELDDTHGMDMLSGMNAQLKTGQWEEIDSPSDGVTFMAYKNGFPAHCGVVIGDKVLHSGGGENHKGACRIDRISAMQRMYRDMRYFRHLSVIEAQK